MDNHYAKKICRLLTILIGVGLLQVGQGSPIGETWAGEMIGMAAFYVGAFIIFACALSLIAGMFSSLLPKD